MARSKRKKTAGPARKASVTLPVDPQRTGMPALDSITGVEEFRKGKKVFRIIHTKELDEYEQVPSKAKRKR